VRQQNAEKYGWPRRTRGPQLPDLAAVPVRACKTINPTAVGGGERPSGDASDAYQGAFGVGEVTDD
jgi:hypothetical protein